mmetsp:Transcript_39298/g.92932  ORF Transcript_39298/g.92932 Transcript_39298/m.92932 type:complete len:370 (+) Transcript_39298:53-1162(+)
MFGSEAGVGDGLVRGEAVDGGLVALEAVAEHRLLLRKRLVVERRRGRLPLLHVLLLLLRRRLLDRRRLREVALLLDVAAAGRRVGGARAHHVAVLLARVLGEEPPHVRAVVVHAALALAPPVRAVRPPLDAELAARLLERRGCDAQLVRSLLHADAAHLSQLFSRELKRTRALAREIPLLARNQLEAGARAARFLRDWRWCCRLDSAIARCLHRGQRVLKCAEVERRRAGRRSRIVRRTLRDHRKNVRVPAVPVAGRNDGRLGAVEMGRMLMAGSAIQGWCHRGHICSRRLQLEVGIALLELLDGHENGQEVRDDAIIAEERLEAHFAERLFTFGGVNVSLNRLYKSCLRFAHRLHEARRVRPRTLNHS